MKLNFSRMEETALPQFRGGEGDTLLRSYSDGANKIMLGRLLPGTSIGMHCHETNSEIIYVLEGVGTMLCDGELETLPAGCGSYCPKGHSHSLRNEGESDLVFFAVVPEQ